MKSTGNGNLRKICVILNVAPHYRKGIFEKIDQNFDAWFVAGTENGDIRNLDFTNFRNPVHWTKNFPSRGFPFIQKGISQFLFKGFETFIISDDITKLNHWSFLLYCKLTGKRTFAWTHGWYGKESFGKKIIKKIFLNLFTGIFLYGDRAKSLMVKEGFNSDKLFVIHNSLDYNSQLQQRTNVQTTDVYSRHFGNRRPVIIFIGRLTAVKKLNLLLEALSNLKKEGKIFNLTFIGDGTETDNLKALCNSLGLNSQVWFYGACYDDRINSELIYNADLCVAPGNIGLTAMHVMMFGCPALTHSDFKWQMPEYEAIRPGITGDFFIKDDIASISQSIYNWFRVKEGDREKVRMDCYNEIDNYWTPEYQIEIIKKAIEQ